MVEKPTYKALEIRIQELENKLLESSSFTEEVMTCMSEGFVLTDTKASVVFTNNRLADMLGYLPEDLIGNCWIDLIPFEHQAIAKDIETRRAQGYTDRYEIVLRRKDGHKFPVLISAGPRFDKQNGQYIGSMGVVTDITERKHSEEALREAKQRFERMLAVVPDMISIHDPQMNILYSNWQGFGSVPEQKRLLGTKCYRTYRGFDTPCPDCLAKKVLRTGHTIQAETQLPDGKWFDLRVIPLMDEQDNVEMFMEWVRDITSTKNIEIELKTQKNLFEGVFDSINDVIGLQLPDHTVVRYNQAGYSLLNLTEAEVKGKKCYELIGRVNPCEICPTSKALATQKMQSLEKYVPELKKHFICTSNPVLDDAGDIKLIIEQLTDITEKKRTDDKLQQAQKLESIGSLAGGIAHDFNNILFPIIGMSELLAEDLPEGSSEYENVKEILTAGKRGSELVKQILAFSRQSEDKRIPVQFQSVLKEVLKLCRSTIPTNIAIHREIQKDCGFINANPTQLHQIAMNLITNAYHAIEPDHGQIWVNLSETELGQDDIPALALEPGRYLLFSVSDTGAGIDSAVTNKIFEPYFTTKAQGKGTGLGLSVVHGIVKAYGGDIKVYSEPGKGATFNVYIPLKEKTREDRPSETVNTDPVGSERILLVDDEAPVGKMQKMMLERLGYQVTCRSSSTDALEAFRSKPDAFDLVITDMTMPNMTGDQLARKILLIRPDIPVVISTGFSDRINKEKSDALGIKGLLKKPILKSDMAKTVRKVLDKANG